MTLRSRLISAVTLILLASTFAGGALAYWSGVRKIDAELAAAMTVGWATVSRGINALPEPRRSPAQLAEIVRLFDGDRHVAAALHDLSGAMRLRSALPASEEPAPGWFTTLLAPPPRKASFEIAGVGSVRLVTDARFEVAEVWAEMLALLAALAVFFVLTLLFALAAARRLVAPLADIAAGFRRIGAGDYAARIAIPLAPELGDLARGFNAMADRLAETEDRTRRLSRQLTAVQDEERADLARNLHDELGPYLFAIDADASSLAEQIRAPVSGDRDRQIADRAERLKGAAGNAKRIVRNLLDRLRPGVVVQLGLAPALRELAGFWEDRHPDLMIDVDVAEGDLGSDIDGALYAVIGEALSNAVRHGAPSRIDITVRREAERIVARIADDGRGIGAVPEGRGYGLLGMRERIAALGGRLTIDRRIDRSGTVVSAVIPVSRQAAAAAAEIES